MRSVLTIIATLVTMISPAVAQQMVTPSTPLGQGFTPNGLQSTPTTPGQAAPLPSIPGQTSNESGLNLYQQNGTTGPKLNWQYSNPDASGRTRPDSPERPIGPSR